MAATSVDVAGQITLFDFDDCVYPGMPTTWPSSFYAVTNRPDADTFGQNFMRHFLTRLPARKRTLSRMAGPVSPPSAAKWTSTPSSIAVFDVDNLTDDCVAAVWLAGGNACSKVCPMALDWPLWPEYLTGVSWPGSIRPL